MMKAVLTLAVLLLCLTHLPRQAQCGARTTRHAHLSGNASTSAETRVHWYTRSAAPAGWVLVGAASPMSPVTFTLVLESSRAAELERRFWRVSDPDDDLFGEWLSHAEIVDLLQPSPALLAVLYAALASHGISAADVANYGDTFVVSSTVARASSLWSTSFRRFRHLRSGREVVRQWGAFSVPSAFVSRLQLRLVLGVHTFPPLEQRALQRKAAEALRVRQAQSPAAPLRPVWVPSAVSGLYGVPRPIAPLSTPLSSAGVIEWERESFSPSDLFNFSLQSATPLPTISAHHIIGPNNSTRPGGEASLDVQWMEAMNPGSTPYFWLVAPDNGWMFDFAVEFLTATDYPSVISLSYGVAEMISCSAFGNTSDCDGVDYRTYLHACDRQFMKMGLLGVSVFVASGDAGTTGELSAAAAVGAQRVLPFEAGYPASSPFITCVGATDFLMPAFNLTPSPPICETQRLVWECASAGEEEGVSDAIGGFVAGGGFSDVFARPAYQADAIAAYLSSGVALPSNASWYNATSRGLPDVTAVGYGGFVVDGGRYSLVGGTSMSTPIWAGLWSLVNADYQAITNTTLGFINPLLYKAQAQGAGLLRDITRGDNCQTPKCVGQQDGFLASKGWDPVTGLGAPVYPAIKAYVEALARTVVERRVRRAAEAAELSHAA